MCMLLFMEEEYDCTLARLKNLNIKDFSRLWCQFGKCFSFKARNRWQKLWIVRKRTTRLGYFKRFHNE